MATAGIVLNIIGLLLSVVNAAIGAYLSECCQVICVPVKMTHTVPDAFSPPFLPPARDCQPDAREGQAGP
jgi:hypothetical protein